MKVTQNKCERVRVEGGQKKPINEEAQGLRYQSEVLKEERKKKEDFINERKRDPPFFCKVAHEL
jgi:hypothetical protein